MTSLNTLIYGSYIEWHNYVLQMIRLKVAYFNVRYTFELTVIKIKSNLLLTAPKGATLVDFCN
jgi:hypothetical protein